MRISSLSIKGLFGYFDHDIQLKTKDRITIIHGPNGVGKTTILRLLNDLFATRFYSLLSIPFERIIVRFQPKGTLTIQKKHEGNRGSLPKLALVLRIGTMKAEHTAEPILERELRHRFPLSIIERMIPHIERIGPREWLDKRTEDVMSLEEVIFRYSAHLPEEIQELAKPIPRMLKEALKDISVYLIETQRLFTSLPPKDLEPRRRHAEPMARMTVEEYADDMVNNIQARMRESGALTASLDRDFPWRLLEKKIHKEAVERNIRKLYTEQSKYRDRLMRSGLIDPEKQVPLPSGKLGEMERKVLWIYLKDVERKLQIFDSLLIRTELLREIISSRFSYKDFVINKGEGFVFTSTHDKSKVPLKALSSGEQHELVLAYDLLFRVKKNSLVLIDEPELSLHVTWQRKFLEDIARISELADLDFLIATHSPSIIHDRRDLMVALGEEE